MAVKIMNALFMRFLEFRGIENDRKELGFYPRKASSARSESPRTAFFRSADFFTIGRMNFSRRAEKVVIILYKSTV